MSAFAKLFLCTKHNKKNWTVMAANKKKKNAATNALVLFCFSLCLLALVVLPSGNPSGYLAEAQELDHNDDHDDDDDDGEYEVASYVNEEGERVVFEGYYSEELDPIFKEIQRDAGIEFELYNTSGSALEEEEEEGNLMLFYVSSYLSDPEFEFEEEEETASAVRRRRHRRFGKRRQEEHDEEGELASFPLMVAPVCIPFHFTLSFGVSVSLNAAELGAMLLGTPSFLFDLTGGSGTAPVWSNSVRLVLAPPNVSGVTQSMFQSLADAGIAGFPSKDVLPTAVEFNPQVIVVKHQRDVAPALKATPNSLGFDSPMDAAAHQLPCMRVKSKKYGALKLLNPRLENAEAYSVDSETNIVSLKSSADVYPFVGPLMMTINATASCLPQIALYTEETIEFFLESEEGKGLDDFFHHWGFVRMNDLSRAAMLRNAVPELCLDKNVYTAVASGGGSASNVAIQGLTLEFLEEQHTFVSYEKTSSSTGIKALTGGSLFFSASERELSEDEHAQYPTIRTVPLLALTVSLVFHLEGMEELQIPMCEVLSILRGRIQYWDDPILREGNPAAVLRHEPICVVARSGKSGSINLLAEGLHRLEEYCEGENVSHTVTISGVWADNNFVANHTFPTYTEILSKVQATRGCIAMVPTPEALEAGVPSAELIDSMTHHHISPTARYTTEALGRVGEADSHAHDDDDGDLDDDDLDDARRQQQRRRQDPDGAGAHTEEEGNGIDVLVDIHMGKDTYPFVGVTHWLFDENHQGDNEHMKAGLEFVQWTLTDVHARNLIESKGFIPMPAKFNTDSVAMIRARAHSDGVLLFPPPEVEKTFPFWVFAIIASVLALAAAGAYRFLAVYFLTKAAPKDSSKPFAVMLLGPKNLTAIFHHVPAENVAEALDTFANIVKKACSSTGCYRVKVINDYHVIAAKSSTAVANCAVSIQTELEKIQWDQFFSRSSKYSPPAKEHAHDDDGLTAAESGSDVRLAVGNASSASSAKHLGAPTPKNSASKSQSRSTAHRRTSLSSGEHSSVNARADSLDVSYGAHYGQGRILYDKELNTYDYTGDVLEVAAMVADVAHAHQILLSPAAMEVAMASGDVKGTCKEYCKKTLKGKKNQTLYQLSGFGLLARSFEPATKTDPLALDNDKEEEEEEESGNILSALEQAQSGITHKRVAVLCVMLPNLAASYKSLPLSMVGDKYRQVYDPVERIVLRNRGAIISFCDGKFIISFNATTPCANPASRAGVCALDIVDSLLCKGMTDVYCGFAPGHAHVGTCSVGDANHPPKNQHVHQHQQHQNVFMSKLINHVSFLAALCVQYEQVHVLTTSAMSENELSMSFYYGVQDMVLFRPTDRVDEVKKRASILVHRTSAAHLFPIAIDADGNQETMLSVPEAPQLSSDVKTPRETQVESTRAMEPETHPETPTDPQNGLARRGSGLHSHLQQIKGMRCIIHLRSTRTATDEADEWMYELRKSSDEDGCAAINEAFFLMAKKGDRAAAIERSHAVLQDEATTTTIAGENGSRRSSTHQLDGLRVTMLQNLRYYLETNEELDALACRRLDTLGGAVIHLFGDIAA